MATSDRNRLRVTFDEDAELYDRVRPAYPAALFDGLCRLAGFDARSRVLEIGPGTGQATHMLAPRVGHITAIEIGASMADVARKRLSNCPNINVVTADFETWPLPQQKFDAVLAFTAWHWLDPKTRSTKAADVLSPGGALATVATHHVAGGTDAFFVEVQDCYERWDLTTTPGLRLPYSETVPAAHDETDTMAKFEPSEFRRYECDIAYSTEAYLDLLQSYSGHRALTPDNLEGLLDCIGVLIDTRYGGKITKRYMHEMRVSLFNP